jgi:hypothetical protein
VESRASRPSAWSVGSLAFFAMAILILLATVSLVLRQVGGDDPAAGAVLLFLVVVGLCAASICSLSGIVAGWLAVRRPRGGLEFAWAGLALNVALCFLGSVVATAGLLAFPVFFLGVCYAAGLLLNSLAGRRPSSRFPTGFWRGWSVGCCCAVLVSAAIYALVRYH